MTLDALIMLAGISVALIPFLGFPINVDNAILVAIGVVVIILGIIVRRRGLTKPHSFGASVPHSAVDQHGE
jgi:hypothetical protein